MTKRVRHIYRANNTYTADGLRGRLLVEDVLVELRKTLKHEGFSDKHVNFLIGDGFHRPGDTHDQVEAAKAERDVD